MDKRLVINNRSVIEPQGFSFDRRLKPIHRVVFVLLCEVSSKYENFDADEYLSSLNILSEHKIGDILNELHNCDYLKFIK